MLIPSVEQQTATAGVLKVISRSPFDLQNVLDRLVETAARLFEADTAELTRRRGDSFYHAAHYGFSPDFFAYIKTVPLPSGKGSLVGRVLIERAAVQIPDALADPGYKLTEAQKRGGFRTLLGVPLLREGNPIGVFSLTRSVVRPFTERQVELLKTFADQAVIALENARLFDEVRARTRELSVALEYQTATGEVLNVISRSPTKLQPVLDTIVQTAARLCSADHSFIARRVDDACHVVAGLADRVDAEHIQYLSRNPVHVDRGSVTGRVAIEKATIHVPDVLADPEFTRFEWQRIGKQRTVLGVPLLREGTLIGVMILARRTVAPFTDKQIDLVTTFANQAVIAIENVRLFEEIQDKSRQLEIANKYKSHFIASASHDLRQPLHALNLFVAQLRSESNPSERARLIGRIDAAVGSMNDLFGVLLDMTKLDAGILEPNVTEFPVERVFKRIETTFAEAAQKKDLEVRVVGSSAWIRSDPVLLERVLLNLVSNAVRYTASGGVVIGCRRRGDRMRIDVCDTGPGIPEDQRQRIFSEFVQLPTPDQGVQRGLGLGLAIVERLGRLLGHDIELRTRSGRGSRFSVTTPLVVAPARADGGLVYPSTMIDPARGKVVVVIDDDPLVLEGMGGILRSWGCIVVGGQSAEAALAKISAEARKPDLIISDYRLASGKTGIEAIKRLQAVAGADIPAFLISGDTAPERLRDASANGLHLLHKPVTPMRLRAVVNQLLNTPAMGTAASAAE